MTGILFDLDGTLLDTLADLTDSVNHALRVFGCPERTPAQVRCAVGNGAGQLLRLSVPTGEDWEAPLAEFRRHYAAHCQDKTAPYPGIPAALEALSRYPMAIVSNKPDTAVKKLCARYFPGVYAQGERPGCPRKPAPGMVIAAMAAIGADKCVYVGDSEVDVLTAKNAGVPCLSVLWGFRDAAQLRQAGGTRFCARPEELPAVLEIMIKELEQYGQ